MSLNDMEAAGELEPMAHSPEELDSLLRMAGRRLADAQLEQLSSESRVVNAYQCILGCAKAALRALDYRVQNGPSQHFTTLETLRFTLSLDPKRISYCHSLRRKRHRDEYEGTLESTNSEAQEAANFAAMILLATMSQLKLA